MGSFPAPLFYQNRGICKMIFSKVFFVWCLVGIVWILFKMRKEKKLKFKQVVYRDGKKKIRVDYLVRGDYK